MTIQTAQKPVQQAAPGWSAEALIARDRARRILRRVAHPKWSVSDDIDVLTMKSQGGNFHEIAEWLGRSRLEVEGRFHRLRIVPRILEHLKASGWSDARYHCGPEK